MRRRTPDELTRAAVETRIATQATGLRFIRSRSPLLRCPSHDRGNDRSKRHPGNHFDRLPRSAISTGPRSTWFHRPGLDTSTSELNGTSGKQARTRSGKFLEVLPLYEATVEKVG